MRKTKCPKCERYKSESAKMCMQCWQLELFFAQAVKRCVVCKKMAIGPHFPNARTTWHMYRRGHNELA